MESSRFNFLNRRTALAVALAGCCVGATLLYAQEMGDPTMGLPSAPAKPLTEDLKKKASYAIGTDIGRSITSLPIKLDIELLKKGLDDMVAGKQAAYTPEELKEAMASMQAEAMKLADTARKETEEKNKKAGAEFLAKNATAEGVKKSPKGVQYKVLKEGTGAQPKPTDSVVVHYKGTLLDGTKFDSSYDRNEPITFPIGDIIQGWQDILPLMKEGSKWQVWIPYDLAYGPHGRPPQIPPYSMLCFDIELISIAKENKDAGKEPAKEPAKK